MNITERGERSCLTIFVVTCKNFKEYSSGSGVANRIQTVGGIDTHSDGRVACTHLENSHCLFMGRYAARTD
jgi:hypothetical protein